MQPALYTPGCTKRTDYVFYRDAALRDANKDRRLTDDLLAGNSPAPANPFTCLYVPDAYNRDVV